MWSKHTLSWFLFQMFINLLHCRYPAKYHYLYRLYREEIRILENGTFPKYDIKKLEQYKEEIQNDEQLFRFKAFIAMNEDSRLYDDIATKCYKRFQSKKRRRKKGMGSEEKWDRRVRFHFLQNFLLQNGYFMVRRNQHITRATTTVLMLPYTTDQILPSFMKKLLPSSMYFKYYLPLTSIIKKVPNRVQSLVKACVDAFRGKPKTHRNHTRKHDSNKTVHRFLRKIERSLKYFERSLKMTNRSITTKRPSKGKVKLKEKARRARRKKRFRKLLHKINTLYPVQTTVDFKHNFGLTDKPTKGITWRTKRKRIMKTTRRKRNITRTTRVMSKKEMRKIEKQRKRKEREDRNKVKRLEAKDVSTMKEIIPFQI